MPPPSNGLLLRFGVFDLNPYTGVLRKNGRPLKLQPQPAKLLCLLVARPNELITREELLQRIWGNGSYGDFEHALNVCISQLREVLDDNADSPRWIETVPRRGYRFLAPTEEIGGVPAPASTRVEQLGLPTHESPAVRLKGKLPLWGVAALVTLAFCFGAGYLLGKRRAPMVSSPSFTRLTYERGIVFSARFASDGHVVYDASWDNKPIRIFTTAAAALSQPMTLDLSSAHLLDISPTGELALALNGYPEVFPVFLRGTLARAPMAGGAPRQLLEDVRWADFDSKGELAVVHHFNGRSRLEYPVGRVLYENTGWISHIRFSPRNDRIAFVDHPSRPDDRGSIAVVDLSGERKTLSTGWESAMGLAWSPRGDEVWFTAAKSGERRELFAVDLDGRQRRLLQVPGGATLHDISLDGRVLLTIDNERAGTTALTPTGERDLSWLDITFPLAISPDGKEVLLDEQSDHAGPDYWIGLRSIDGSPPVRLGEGVGGSFSPDGKWTATNISSIPESTFLLPIGAGQRKELKHPGVRTFGPVWFVQSGKSVLFLGAEPGHSARSYIQSLESGPPQPITPEGILGGYPSPDGRYLVALQPDRTWVLYDIQSRESHAIPGTMWHLWPVDWSTDSRYLYLYTRTAPPSQIWRLEISNGQMKLVTQLGPGDAAGILETFNVAMTPDAKTFVYGYDRYLSELYLVDSLR